MEFLKQPYPYFHKGKELARTGAFVLITGFLVLYLLEPFERDYNEHMYSYVIICLAHAGVGFLTYLAFFSVLNFWVDEEEWTRGREFAAIFFMLLFIGVGEFLIRYVIYKPRPLGLPQLGEEVLHALLIGPVIFFIISTIHFQWRNVNYQKSAGKLRPDALAQGTSDEAIAIKAGTAGDDFYLNPSEIICIKSDGNYLEFFVRKSQAPEKLLKRLTLQSAQEQLRDFPFILKTHRAFLVNIQHLEQVKGNAQGYQLKLRDLEFTVPVSRGHIDGFNGAVS